MQKALVVQRLSATDTPLFVASDMLKGDIAIPQYLYCFVPV